MHEDNSRFHLNCVWVDHPCEERARVLLGCTADHPVRETRANFENIVRVVALLPRCVGGPLGLPVGNLRYFGAKFRLRVSDPRSQRILDLRPLDHAKGLGPWREAVSSVIRNQFLER